MERIQTLRAWKIAGLIARMLVIAGLGWAVFMKLTQPVDALAKMWPWAGELSPEFVRFTGVLDLLGALGLLFPVLFKMRPPWTYIAGVGILLLMIFAAAFHISRDELSDIGVNVFFALLVVLILWSERR